MGPKINGRGDPFHLLPSPGRVYVAPGPEKPRQRDPGAGKGRVRAAAFSPLGQSPGKNLGTRTATPGLPAPLCPGPGCGRTARASQDALALTRASRPAPSARFPSAGLGELSGVRLPRGAPKLLHTAEPPTRPLTRSQPAGCPRRPWDSRRPAGAGPGRGSAQDPDATPPADPRLRPREGRGTQVFPGGKVKVSRRRVRASRHPAAGTGAPHPPPRDSPTPRWRAWPSRLTKGSGAAPKAGVPATAEVAQAGASSCSRDSGPSATAACSPLLLLRHLGGAPCQGVALPPPGVGER